MKMKSNMSYEIPWRPAFEYYASMGWATGGAFAYYVNEISRMSTPLPSEFIITTCAGMALIRLRKGVIVTMRRRALGRGKLEFIKLKGLARKMNGKMKKEASIWVGKGFLWSPEVANRAYDLLDRGVEDVIGKNKTNNGAYWLHGVGMEDKDRGWLQAYTSGHSLIVGTTGSGKTRLFDLLITQAILRGEVVIVIDPKGDKELRANMMRAYDFIGKPENMKSFHPAFPEESVRIDPMRNWNRSTEIASRLAALIPSETGADPFTAFGWKAINDIVQGLIMINERPDLRSIRRYIEGGVETLVVRSLEAYFEKNVDDWQKKAESYIKKVRDQALGYIALYRADASVENRSQALDGLLSGFEHNREHFQKMVAALIPILSMLTSEPLDQLLSPSISIDDDREMTDFSKIINNGMGIYMGLDSLSDTTVGSAIGSVLLADLTAVAGDRYNYGVDNKPINVFIDEAAEVINKPVIQLMNKGRGANFSVHVATQTFADFVVRLGDEAQARQVLGNANNTFILRVHDGETQKYLAESMPPFMQKTVDTTLKDGQSSDDDGVAGGTQETMTKTERELINPSMFGMLPNLHMFAKFMNGQVYKLKIPVLIDK